MATLKPCPFCGGDPIRMHSNHIAYVVRCTKCKAQTDKERCEVDADDAWNRRVPPLDLTSEAVVEAVARACDPVGWGWYDGFAETTNETTAHTRDIFRDTAFTKVRAVIAKIKELQQ